VKVIQAGSTSGNGGWQPKVRRLKTINKKQKFWKMLAEFFMA
jgi:hypothetical protein